MGFITGTLASLFVVYATMIMLHADPALFLDAHAFVIVVCGATCATATSTRLIHVPKIPIYAIQCMLPPPIKKENVIIDIKRMADKARAGGLPALTSEIPTAPDEFVRRGLKMLVAGTDSHFVHRTLESELGAIEKRHHEVFGFFEIAGGFMPTFGLIGTVLGIIVGLGDLSDIDALGHALAVALTATLYGVFTANVFAMPIASKLKWRSQEEIEARKMMLEGFICIQEGRTSDTIDRLMKGYVDPKTRAKIEGGKVGGKKVEKHIEYTTYMDANDQEKALALIAEVKKETEAKNLGQDDLKLLLADLINEANDKVLMKDFASEYMKLKQFKKLPKGAIRKGAKRKKAKKRALD